MIANPLYAIGLDPALAVRHVPIISEDQWITANIELIANTVLKLTCETYRLSQREAYFLIVFHVMTNL
jgi:hypothetical protein